MASADQDTERPGRTPSARELAEPATVWLVYGIGAIVGGTAALRWQFATIILLPIAVVAVVVVTAAVLYRRR